ncbi:MAG: hypothetical protein ACK4NH_14685, partial [Gemmobacter sp.]
MTLAVDSDAIAHTLLRMTRSFLNRRSMMTLMATALVAPVAGAQAAPRIVATTGLIAEAARRLTGFDIRAIAAPPHDPALHRPGRSDLV